MNVFDTLILITYFVACNCQTTNFISRQQAPKIVEGSCCVILWIQNFRKRGSWGSISRHPHQKKTQNKKQEKQPPTGILSVSYEIIALILFYFLEDLPFRNGSTELRLIMN